MMSEDQAINNCGSMWAEVSEQVKVAIPVRLINILDAMGYCDRSILLSFGSATCDEHFDKINIFMQEKMYHLIRQEQMFHYYGIFQKVPEMFELLQGDKAILMRIGNYYVEEERKQKRNGFFSTPTRSRSGAGAPSSAKSPSAGAPSSAKSPSAGAPSSAESTSVSATTESLQESTTHSPTKIDLSKEKEKLEEIIQNYIEKLDTKVEIILPRLADVVECGEVLQSSIHCGMCNSGITVQKTAESGGGTSWTTFNFYKHLKKCIKKIPCSTQKISKFFLGLKTKTTQSRRKQEDDGDGSSCDDDLEEQSSKGVKVYAQIHVPKTKPEAVAVASGSSGSSQKPTATKTASASISKVMNHDEILPDMSEVKVERFESDLFNYSDEEPLSNKVKKAADYSSDSDEEPLIYKKKRRTRELESDEDSDKSGIMREF